MIKVRSKCALKKLGIMQLIQIVIWSRPNSYFRRISLYIKIHPLLQTLFLRITRLYLFIFTDQTNHFIVNWCWRWFFYKMHLISLSFSCQSFDQNWKVFPSSIFLAVSCKVQLVGKLKLFILHLNRSLHRGNLSERSSTKVQIISELILAAASSHYLNYCRLQHLNLGPLCVA